MGLLRDPCAWQRELLVTNLTGHPAVVLPWVRKRFAVAIMFTGGVLPRVCRYGLRWRMSVHEVAYDAPRWPVLPLTLRTAGQAPS